MPPIPKKPLTPPAGLADAGLGNIRTVPDSGPLGVRAIVDPPRTSEADFQTVLDLLSQKVFGEKTPVRAQRGRHYDPTTGRWMPDRESAKALRNRPQLLVNLMYHEDPRVRNFLVQQWAAADPAVRDQIKLEIAETFRLPPGSKGWRADAAELLDALETGRLTPERQAAIAAQAGSGPVADRTGGVVTVREGGPTFEPYATYDLDDLPEGADLGFDPLGQPPAGDPVATTRTQAPSPPAPPGVKPRLEDRPALRTPEKLSVEGDKGRPKEMSVVMVDGVPEYRSLVGDGSASYSTPDAAAALKATNRDASIKQASSDADARIAEEFGEPADAVRNRLADAQRSGDKKTASAITKRIRAAIGDSLKNRKIPQRPQSLKYSQAARSLSSPRDAMTRVATLLGNRDMGAADQAWDLMRADNDDTITPAARFSSAEDMADQVIRLMDQDAIPASGAMGGESARAYARWRQNLVDTLHQRYFEPSSAERISAEEAIRRDRAFDSIGNPADLDSAAVRGDGNSGASGRPQSLRQSQQPEFAVYGPDGQQLGTISAPDPRSAMEMARGQFGDVGRIRRTDRDSARVDNRGPVSADPPTGRKPRADGPSARSPIDPEADFGERRPAGVPVDPSRSLLQAEEVARRRAISNSYLGGRAVYRRAKDGRLMTFTPANIRSPEKFAEARARSRQFAVDEKHRQLDDLVRTGNLSPETAELVKRDVSQAFDYYWPEGEDPSPVFFQYFSGSYGGPEVAAHRQGRPLKDAPPDPTDAGEPAPDFYDGPSPDFDEEVAAEELPGDGGPGAEPAEAIETTVPTDVGTPDPVAIGASPDADSPSAAINRIIATLGNPDATTEEIAEAMEDIANARAALDDPSLEPAAREAAQREFLEPLTAALQDYRDRTSAAQPATPADSTAQQAPPPAPSTPAPTPAPSAAQAPGTTGAPGSPSAPATPAAATPATPSTAQGTQVAAPVVRPTPTTPTTKTTPATTTTPTPTPTPTPTTTPTNPAPSTRPPRRWLRPAVIGGGATVGAALLARWLASRNAGALPDPWADSDAELMPTGVDAAGVGAGVGGQSMPPGGAASIGEPGSPERMAHLRRLFQNIPQDPRPRYQTWWSD